MPPQQRATAAPWITAAVAGVLLAALVLVYFVVLVPDKDDKPAKQADVGALTTSEKQAVVAAGTETANLLSFTRAHFASDFKRALDGATGALKSDVTNKKAATLSAMTKGKFDLGANVTYQALEGPTEKGSNGYLVLVTLNAFRSTTQDQPIQQNLEVTVLPVKGKWLASDVQSIGLQQ
jgi:hypothetical protein